MDKLSKSIVRKVMSDEDNLIYTIKHGHEPKFRIESYPMSDGPNEYSDKKHYMMYVLTNIPKD